MSLRYTNPVFNGHMADPFVLKHGVGYFAYGTGPRDPGTGRVFRLLHSPDLVNWTDLCGALNPLAGEPATAYWAPEVCEQNGVFLMYYSAATGGDETHRLRAARAASPEGPFEDIGYPLFPNEGFTIDASPFRDPADGRWYLYFAKDFTDGERPGTGAVVIALAEDRVTSLAAPVTVVRPTADWQVYERHRTHYNRLWPAWYTVEGPFTLYRNGRYYCLYSGGAWHSPDYGVAYAVADHPLGPWTDMGFSGPNVLKGIPNRVVGPGHCSVVVGPSGTDYIVYHAWDRDRTARRMCIDPIRWTTDGPVCDGPTSA